MMMKQTPKADRCREACLQMLQSVAPHMLGHRKLALLLADPYRKVAAIFPIRAGVTETYSDELVRKTLNALLEEGLIESKMHRSVGLKMIIFGAKDVSRSKSTTKTSPTR